MKKYNVTVPFAVWVTLEVTARDEGNLTTDFADFTHGCGRDGLGLVEMGADAGGTAVLSFRLGNARLTRWGAGDSVRGPSHERRKGQL